MLALYIHTPFCMRKCHYCGFYSAPYTPELADAYLDALGLEAASYRYIFSDRVFETVYLGGGTPTSLTAGQLERIILIIKEHFRMSKDAEFTIEANPGTLTEQKLEVLLTQGLNRLSIGVQSFSDDILVKLGRIHSARQAVDAVMLARKAGFTNVGMDLIYGIPGQTTAQWGETLRKAVELGPEHLSVYSLSYDDGTVFAKEAESGRLIPMGDEQVAVMYDTAVGVLSGAGYEHYEISNFSLPGFECRHNVNYWERGEYLGLGPAAWSFISGRRYANVADSAEYRRRLDACTSAVDREESLTGVDAVREGLMLGLRTSRGIDLDACARVRSFEGRQRWSEDIARLERAGLITWACGRLRLTDRGMFVSNEVLNTLMP